MGYRKKSYRGKRGYGSRSNRRSSENYHQPMPPNREKIPYAKHTLTKKDVEAVVDAMLSGTLTVGEEIKRFEVLLGKLTHSRHAIAVSSGTAAIHAALACLELGPEDEVIASTLNFCAVANMVNLIGAKLVLVDCDSNTLTISPQAVVGAISENTKVVLANNFGGHPADMKALREICTEHNLFLVEDACHGLGGRYRGHYVGNQADLTCFSFHPSKAITSAEGGAVTTNDSAKADWIRKFRHHGIQKNPQGFVTEGEFPDYYQECQMLGMNYRMNELQAALGRSQLQRLDRHIERRRAIAQIYYDKMHELDSLILPYVADWADSAYHLFPIQMANILADKRDEVFKELQQQGIGVQVHYIPIHRMPLYRDRYDAACFPNAENYFRACFSLPIFPDLSYKELERLLDVVKKTVKKFEDEALRGQKMKQDTAKDQSDVEAEVLPVVEEAPVAAKRPEVESAKPAQARDFASEEKTSAGDRGARRWGSGRGRDEAFSTKEASADEVAAEKSADDNGDQDAARQSASTADEETAVSREASVAAGRLRLEPKGKDEDSEPEEKSKKASKSKAGDQADPEADRADDADKGSDEVDAPEDESAKKATKAKTTRKTTTRRKSTTTGTKSTTTAKSGQRAAGTRARKTTKDKEDGTAAKPAARKKAATRKKKESEEKSGDSTS